MIREQCSPLLEVQLIVPQALQRIGVDPRTVLALEKPFGTDQRTAHELRSRSSIETNR